MGRARILVVEDEGIIAEDLRMGLEEMGYDVVAVASTGEDAVREAQERRPDLVLMDVVLHGDMDGIEAAERIHARLNIPVIYLTAYSDEKILERAKIAEPFGYMIKPIRERDLYSTIEMALFKHEMERRLKESEQWFSGVLRSIGDAVIATDWDGAVKFMNPVAEALTGWSEQDAHKRPLCNVFVVVDEKTREPFADLRGVLLNDGKQSTGERLNSLLRRRNEEMFVETGASPIRNEHGEMIGTVLVFRDVTDARNVYERLRLLSAATEQSSEGISVVDLDGKVLFINQAFAEMHGLRRDQILGRHVSIFHNKEQMPSVRVAMRIVREHGIFSGEIWHARADGTTFPGLMHNSLLRDEQGEGIGVIGTLKDITSAKKAEEALRESHEKLEAYSSSLEEMVRTRTQDLENSRKELKKYSESLEKTNEALKLIIQGVEAQKKDVEEKIAHNLNLTVSPIIDQLKSQDLPETAQFLLKSLEFNVTNIASTFGVRMTKEGHRLTPRELRICDMIRSGLSSKQMAKVMGISPQTILVHRKNIRKKLGLAKAKKNLASYLKSSL